MGCVGMEGRMRARDTAIGHEELRAMQPCITPGIYIMLLAAIALLNCTLRDYCSRAELGCDQEEYKTTYCTIALFFPLRASHSMYSSRLNLSTKGLCCIPLCVSTLKAQLTNPQTCLLQSMPVNTSQIVK